jgi:hypothetical protein
MYLFNSKLDPIDHSINTLVIFSGQLEGDDFTYGARLERELDKYPVAPDYLLFIFPHYLRYEISVLVSSHTNFNRDITRYGNKTKIQFFTFDEFSELSNFSCALSQDYFKRPDLIKHEIIRQGLINLVELRKDDVIQTSPPGTIFVKPSGELYDEFIKASELSIGYAQNQFVAFCLLSKRPRNRDVRNIWIDSSSISTFIDCLSYYMYRFSNSSCKLVKYHSFNSYDGLEKNKPDYVEDVWVIISASTSNNLGIKACKDWGLTNEQVTTLLSYKDSSDSSIDGLKVNGDEIVVNISDFSSSRKIINKKGSEIGVRVMGENFTPHVKSQNRVDIRAVHKPSYLEKSIYCFHNHDVYYCNRTDRFNRLRAVYVDIEYIFNTESKIKSDLIKWIEDCYSWHFPIETKWVVFDEGCETSHKIWNVIAQKLLTNNEEHLAKIKVVDIDEAESHISGSGAVVVISPVVSSARSLLVLNRNLRTSKHTGNRIFFTPFVISESKIDYERMVKTLTYGPNGNKYEFYDLHRIFIGSSSYKSSWACELEIIENFNEAFWKNRTKLLAELSNGLLNNLSTPPAPSIEELRFSQDFAFWPDTYKPSEVRSSTVYLSIASIFQGLRDRPFTSHDTDSLSSNIYQHAVLDPENFVRFDDPLLHSCFWRAATSSEMDWRSSAEASSIFTNFMKKQIRMLKGGDKNATFDIFIGLACKRIQIGADCLNELVSFAAEQIQDNQAFFELLNFIKINLLKTIQIEDAEPF